MRNGRGSGARMYGLRSEIRNAARAGVRARDYFNRAQTLDPRLQTPIWEWVYTIIMSIRYQRPRAYCVLSWVSREDPKRMAFAGWNMPCVKGS